jgi:heme-degrading monooxygenase HmoA
VIGVTVTFNYKDGFDRARVMEIAANARVMFEGMPGLLYKFFTLDPEQGRAMNFYVWDSEEAARDFFSPELRERVTGLYGTAPTIAYVEIAEVVENRSVET